MLTVGCNVKGVGTTYVHKTAKIKKYRTLCGGFTLQVILYIIRFVIVSRHNPGRSGSTVHMLSLLTTVCMSRVTSSSQCCLVEEEA